MRSLAFLNDFKKNKDGAVFVYAAVVLTVLLGMGALATEAASWYYTQRNMQNAADLGAESGLVALEAGDDGTDITHATSKRQARTEPALKNYINGTNATVTVNIPPASGPNLGKPHAVEVTISQPATLLFSKLFLGSAPNIAARAVAMVQNSSVACILALDPSASGALTISDGTVKAPDCVLVSNSSSAQSVKVTNSANVDALSAHAAGGYSNDSSGSVKFVNPVATNAGHVNDPFANKPVPIFSASADSAHTNVVFSDKLNAQLTPGTYRGGITTKNTTNLNFAPGTYFLDQGNFAISSQTTLTCSACSGTAGVTFVLTSSGPISAIGTVQIAGSAKINLPAPTDKTNPTKYPLPGFLFFQDRQADPTKPSNFTSGTDVITTGNIYFPSSPVVWSGNNTTSSTHCTIIIGRTISITSSTNINDLGCSTADFQTPIVGGYVLVE